MSEPKTRPGSESPLAYLEALPAGPRREDSLRLLALMTELSGEAPRLWGGSIVGFGSYAYQYASGRSGEWPLTGFSPRKQALTVYLMSGLDRHEELLGRLGRFRRGKSCLYLKRLADTDPDVLRALIAESLAWMREAYPAP